MRHIISALWVGLQLTANAAELQTTEMAQKASAWQGVAIDVGLFDRVGLPKSILDPAKAAAVGARETAMSFLQEEKSGFESRFPREPPTRSPYAQRTRLTIEVHICNHTAIPNESLDLARQETARILERIDVSTLWVVCSVTAQEVAGTDWLRDTRPVFVLRILPKQMADKLQPGSDIFGFAYLPENEGFGVVADIYADRSRALAHAEQFGVVLGRVMVHELGHLLLGKKHSATGLMQARWSIWDVESARQVSVFFPSEARRIRAQILARMANNSAPAHPARPAVEEGPLLNHDSRL